MAAAAIMKKFKLYQPSQFSSDSNQILQVGSRLSINFKNAKPEVTNRIQDGRRRRHV
jgi:hypothetical protein